MLIKFCDHQVDGPCDSDRDSDSSKAYLLRALRRALERLDRDRLGVGLGRELNQGGAVVDPDLLQLVDVALELGLLG